MSHVSLELSLPVIILREEKRGERGIWENQWGSVSSNNSGFGFRLQRRLRVNDSGASSVYHAEDYKVADGGALRGFEIHI